MSTTLTSTQRFALVKPLDGDWDALGRTMRALRAPLHRVLNGTVVALELAKPSGDKTHPRSLSYRLVRDLWRRERAAAAERVARGTPYTGDEAIAMIEPASCCVLGAAGQAYAGWAKWDKERWRGSRVLPTYRGGGPIFVTSHGVRMLARDGNAVLRVRLGAGRDGWTDLVVNADGGSAHAALRSMLAGVGKVGDAKLVEETRRGKRGWMVFVTWTREREERSGGRVMAVHRGVRNFLTVAIAAGTGDDAREAYTTTLATGEDVRAHKDAYSARRRSLGRHRRELGAGARGHGKDRREEHITRLEDAEARWTRSKCQEVAAHAMKLAERRGVTKILIEDWGNPAKDGAPELGEFVERLVRQFPLAELREALEWAAKKRGYATEIVASDGNSRTCPVCLHEHETAQVGTFRCSVCALERSVDVIYPWNMLRRAGLTVPHADSKRAMKRAAGRLRPKAAKAA